MENTSFKAWHANIFVVMREFLHINSLLRKKKPQLMYSLSENVQKNSEVISITLNIVRIAVDRMFWFPRCLLLPSLGSSCWCKMPFSLTYSSKDKIISVIRVSPAMSSLSITEHCLDGIGCSYTFVHDFGSRRSAEYACKWEKPRALTAVLLPVWEQGTGLLKRSRERISHALVDCTVHTRDASASAKHHVLFPSYLSQIGSVLPGHVRFAVHMHWMCAHSFLAS